jgi:hypothetical protein
LGRVVGSGARCDRLSGRVAGVGSGASGRVGSYAIKNVRSYRADVGSRSRWVGLVRVGRSELGRVTGLGARAETSQRGDAEMFLIGSLGWSGYRFNSSIISRGSKSRLSS